MTGTISSSAVSGGIYTITLATPYNGNGNFTGSASIRFEGEAAERIRKQVPQDGTITMAKLSASNAAATGKFLAVDSSDATKARFVDAPNATIEGVFGITGNPSDGQIIKRVNGAWAFAADAVGGQGGGITLAEARSGLSAGSGAIVSYANGTGVFTTNTANLATAMEGILTEGSNVTITQSGNSITIAATGDGGGATLANFDSISDSTILDKSNDGVLMYDGDSLARLGLDRFEEEIEPLELKSISLGSYTYQNVSLPSGAGRWTISTIGSTKYAIFNGKNTDETRQLSKIMTPNFKVRVQGSNASRWFEFVVTAAAATQGGSILGVINDDFIDSSAANQGIPFSNDESCTVTSNGRHVSYGDLEHTLDTSRRTQGASAYGVGSYVQGLKATERDVEVGTNDAKWVSPKQLADRILTFTDPTTWSGFTYSESGVAAGTLNRIGEDANVDYLFQIVTTQAIAQEMDSKFKPGELITFRRDASNVTTSRVQYADARAAPSGGNWLFEVKISEDSDVLDETGDFTGSGSISVIHASQLEADLLATMIASQAQAQASSPGNDTLMTPLRTKQAIETHASGGGTKATKAQAIAGSNDSAFMTPLRTHDVVEHLAHVASFVGFQNQSSINAQGTNLAEGAFHFNSAGTQFWARGHNATEGQSLLNQFLIDRSAIVERTGARFDFDFSDVESVAVSGSTNGVVKCTITSHEATPTNPSLTGTDWIIRVLPEQNKQILNHAPKGSIPGIALAEGAVGPREAEGLFQKTVMKMRDSTQIGMVSNASTRFNESVASTNPSAKRLWAIGDGTSSSAQFSKRTNMSLVPGTITHSTMRARPNGKYFVRIDGLGVIYCSNADANNDLPHGVDIGLGFRHKAITSNTWPSWQICQLSDITETIDGNSVTTYDASELWGSTSLENLQNDSASGNSRAASIFREKRVIRRVDGNFFADVSPPFWVEFGIGEGEVFPLVNRDYQFRFIFSPAEISGTTRINRIYNYTEILLADKIE